MVKGHSLESEPQGTTAAFDNPSTEPVTNTSQVYTRQTKIPELHGGYCLQFPASTQTLLQNFLRTPTLISTDICLISALEVRGHNKL